MTDNSILKCAICGCKNLHEKIRSAQLEAGIEPTGIKRYLNERLLKHETAIEITRQMKMDVDVDVDHSEACRNVDFRLTIGDSTEFIGECKVWRSNRGEPELRGNQGII